MDSNFLEKASGFPRAILHFDGDSFFASVEQALDYTLRGKPVITGGERGAATAISIEAKRKGVRRGMTLKEIKLLCPDAIIVPSNYTAYSIYAKRMYAIVRRFTPRVEEYSIDECFAEITGLDQYYNLSYEAIARVIQQALEERLGVTFGVGLAPNKVVAKIASKHRKPGGLTAIPVEAIDSFIEKLPSSAIWGIGPKAAAGLRKLGIETALDLKQKDERWLRYNQIAKPYREIWYELQGGFAKPLGLVSEDIASIIKSRTFSPPTTDQAFLFSQLSKNMESACAKARRRGMLAREISFYVKTQEFTYHGEAFHLARATSSAAEIMKQIAPRFPRYYHERVPYRTTGVSLRALIRENEVPHDLFGEDIATTENMRILRSIDGINKRYGNATVFLASSLSAINYREPKRRVVRASTPSLTLEHDFRKKTFDLPFLGSAH